MIFRDSIDGIIPSFFAFVHIFTQIEARIVQKKDAPASRKIVSVNSLAELAYAARHTAGYRTKATMPTIWLLLI